MTTEKTFTLRAYNDLKKKVQEWEKTNHSALMIFETREKEKDDNKKKKRDDRWYRMGGNSLLIYNFILAPRLKTRPMIHNDTDFGDIVFEDGIINFNGTSGLEKRLKTLEVLKKKKFGSHYILYELNIPAVPDGDFVEYRLSLAKRREKLAQIVRPSIEIRPDMYATMRALVRRTAEVSRKMDGFFREVAGRGLVQNARGIISTYLRMCYGDVPEKNGWDDIAGYLKEEKIAMVVCSELGVISDSALADLAELVVHLEK